MHGKQQWLSNCRPVQLIWAVRPPAGCRHMFHHHSIIATQPECWLFVSLPHDRDRSKASQGKD